MAGLKINYLTETSLTRLMTHNAKHDCGTITAWRDEKPNGESYTKYEKRQRNVSLELKLTTTGYSVTRIRGSSKEGEQTVFEDSFFVVDINDKGTLKADLKKLGELFDQDSVLFIPKGAFMNNDHAMLIGTNHSKDNFVPYGTEKRFDTSKLSKGGDFATFVNGKTFVFEDTCKPAHYFGNIMGKHFHTLLAKSHWSELNLSTDINETIEKYTERG